MPAKESSSSGASRQHVALSLRSGTVTGSCTLSRVAPPTHVARLRTASTEVTLTAIFDSSRKRAAKRSGSCSPRRSYGEKGLPARAVPPRAPTHPVGDALTTRGDAEEFGVARQLRRERERAAAQLGAPELRHRLRKTVLGRASRQEQERRGTARTDRRGGLLRAAALEHRCYSAEQVALDTSSSDELAARTFRRGPPARVAAPFRQGARGRHCREAGREPARRVLGPAPRRVLARASRHELAERQTRRRRALSLV